MLLLLRRYRFSGDVRPCECSGMAGMAGMAGERVLVLVSEQRVANLLE